MRKITAICMTLALCLGLFAGCGSKTDSTSSAVEMKEGQTVQTVFDQIEQDVGIAMPADIDEAALKDIFHVNPDDVEEFAGKFAMVNTSADNILVVKAKEGKTQAVADALNQRLEDVRSQFAQYLPDQKEKSEKGKVVQKGNYVFLLILGSDVETFDAEMEKAEKIINDAF